MNSSTHLSRRMVARAWLPSFQGYITFYCPNVLRRDDQVFVLIHLLNLALRSLTGN
ncbi:MAG: hypothetical protein V7L29_12130 [Nostoc sp.]|uniref:hypothetical protein n=1 Tax=Nostoc sp. TaxID=1180 RepID=UPI002FEFA970